VSRFLAQSVLSWDQLCIREKTNVEPTNKSMKIASKLAFSAALLLGTYANANTVTAVGTLGGQSVNASATITAGAGSVTVELDNLQANPTSVIQLISGLSFDITGASGSGTLSRSITSGGNVTTISSGGAFTAPASGDPLTRWVATETGTSVKITTLSGGNPDRLIIGPPSGGLYSAANASILGDNPNIFETVTFSITVPGVTANSTISGGTIFFGTGSDHLSLVPDGGMTLALLGFAVLGLGSVRRFLKV
jgi:hypothetical protein